MRNPIAGVLALAEAVDSAPDPEAARKRSRDLLQAAQETADLGQKLLLLERAKAISPASAMEDIDLGPALASWTRPLQDALDPGITLDLSVEDQTGHIKGDPTMLREAIANLIDNALRHGGPELSRIEVHAARRVGDVVISVSDNGVGLSIDEAAAARERFRPVSATSGSGLGVSIVEAVLQGHGGTLEITPLNPGLRIEMTIPAG